MDQQPKGLGADAGNPQIMALQGLQLMEKGAQLLVQGFPALQDPLGQVVTSYEPTNTGWWKRYARAKDIDD